MIENNNNRRPERRKKRVVVFSVFVEEIRKQSSEKKDDTLFRERGKDGPHELVGSRFGGLSVQVQVEQLPNPFHGQLVVVIIQRSEGIFQDV